MEKVITKKVRFSYVNVFEARALEGGDAKYSITLLIPKADTETYNKIVNAMNKTLSDSVAEVFKGVMPTNPKFPIYDGDGLRPSGEPFGEECKGHWVITANSKEKPEVVDVACNPIMSKNDFYSGCYGRASIVFFAYNTNGNKGVGCGLNNLQKLEDGQPLSGRSTAAEDFGAPDSAYTASVSAAAPATPYAEGFAGYNQPPINSGAQVGPATQPVQNPYMQQGTVNPITGQPINNIYGVN